MAPLDFPFFELPAELRGDILSRLLISPFGIVLHSRTIFGDSPINKYTVLCIFLVNVQMYQEASAIFYGQNHFILNGQSHRLPGNLTGPGGFLSEQGQDARRRIHNFSLFLTRIGGEVETVLAPAISDMVLRGCLRTLKIYLGQPGSSRSIMPGSDFVTRPPFQALLSLLSDPDLRHVELWAWRAHRTVFCPFHSPVKGPSERVDGQGLATINGTSDWIQLDWAEMVNILGTTERISKVEAADI
ncbi:hypothetical protein GGS20DRAFT_542746 [Poronia punctata]|nr:hypothetical protein GGS20DRAFT_542746 [Poronia punctata]